LQKIKSNKLADTIIAPFSKGYTNVKY